MAYLLWFGAILLIGLDFLLLRAVINQWYWVLGFPANAHKAIDRLYFFLAGAVWVFLIFFIEGFFREGVLKENLQSRLKMVFGRAGVFAIIMAILLGIISLYVNMVN